MGLAVFMGKCIDYGRDKATGTSILHVMKSLKFIYAVSEVLWPSYLYPISSVKHNIEQLALGETVHCMEAERNT